MTSLIKKISKLQSTHYRYVSMDRLGTSHGSHLCKTLAYIILWVVQLVQIRLNLFPSSYNIEGYAACSQAPIIILQVVQPLSNACRILVG